jgi:poly(A) polymerase
MLRAARFVAGHGLRPDPALLTAIDALAPRMGIVSVERRRDELDKLLTVSDPRLGLRLIVDHGLAPFVLPDLAGADDHVVERALDAVRSLPPLLPLRLAAVVGAADRPERSDVARRLRDLRYSNEMVSVVSAIVDGAAMVWDEPEHWTSERVRRLAAATGSALADAVTLASTRVDTTGLRSAIDAIGATESLDSLEPALDGEDVMSVLRIGPGAAVGEALRFLRELRLTEGVLGRDEATSRLVAWWSQRADGG